MVPGKAWNALKLGQGGPADPNRGQRTRTLLVLTIINVHFCSVADTGGAGLDLDPEQYENRSFPAVRKSPLEGLRTNTESVTEHIQIPDIPKQPDPQP